VLQATEPVQPPGEDQDRDNSDDRGYGKDGGSNISNRRQGTALETTDSRCQGRTDQQACEWSGITGDGVSLTSSQGSGVRIPSAPRRENDETSA